MPDRSYLLRGMNDTAVAGYYKLMVESAVMLGAERSRAEKEMLDGNDGSNIVSRDSLTLSLPFQLFTSRRFLPTSVRHSLCAPHFLICPFLFPVSSQYSLPREERRNISLLYNKVTVAEMSVLAPNVSR